MKLSILSIAFLMSSSVFASHPKNTVEVSFDSEVIKKNHGEGERAVISGEICFNKKIHHGKVHCSKNALGKKYEAVASFPNTLTTINNLNISGNKIKQFEFTTLALDSSELNQFTLSVIRKGAKNSLKFIKLKGKLEKRIIKV